MGLFLKLNYTTQPKDHKRVCVAFLSLTKDAFLGRCWRWNQNQNKTICTHISICVCYVYCQGPKRKTETRDHSIYFLFVFVFLNEVNTRNWLNRSWKD